MIKLAAATYAHKATPLSPAQAAVLGSNYEFVVTNPAQLSAQDAVVRQNGARVFRYTKTNQEKNGSHPAAWYSHQVGGKVIRQDTHWNVFCMEPTNPDWIKYHFNELVAICKSENVDGIFSDSAGSFSFTQGGNKAAKPPTWMTPYTLASWLNAIDLNLDTFATVIAPKPLILNGLEPATMEIFTPTIGLLEAEYGSKSNVLPSLNVWTIQTQFIIDAQNAGWSPWVWIKLFGTTYSSSADMWRNFIAPTMLLVDNGSLYFDLSPSEGGPAAWVTQEYTHPIYHADIGTPVAPVTDLAELKNVDCYVRHYTDGFVIVNPTTVGQNITVIDGVAPFFVAPQSGTVYKAVVDYVQVS